MFGAYLVSKAVWAKGFTELLSLLERTSVPVRARVYGSGEDAEAIERRAAEAGLACREADPAWSRAAPRPPLARAVFAPGVDHLELLRSSAAPRACRAFVNPCSTDVVATSTAEALAAGRWAVVARAPCNEAFLDPALGLANVLTFASQAEFDAAVRTALAEPPAPLTPAQRAWFSWPQATERFLDAAELSQAELRPTRRAQVADAAARAVQSAVAAVGGKLLKKGAGGA